MNNFLTDVKKSFAGMNAKQKVITGAIAVLIIVLFASLFFFSSPSSNQKEYKGTDAPAVVGESGYKGNRYFTSKISFIPPGKPDVILQKNDISEEARFLVEENLFSITTYPPGYFSLSELTGFSKPAKRKGFFLSTSSVGEGNYGSAAGIIPGATIQIQAASSRPQKDLKRQLNLIIDSIRVNG